MKIREKLFYIFLAAMFGGLFLIRTIFVYGAADQDAEKVRKEQIRRLQAEQNAYSEAIAQEAFGEIWNTMQKTEVHWETSDNTLFDFLQALTIKRRLVTRLSFDDLKAMYPINNAFVTKKERMKVRVRYGENPEFFGFDFIYAYDENLLSVVYSDINEEGKFTKINFNADPNQRQPQWRFDFYGNHGVDELHSYKNLGTDGLIRYVLTNECYSAERFLELNEIESDGEKEGDTCGESYLEYGACESKYGKLNIFYYYGAGEEASRLLILFEENRRYDYIMVSDYTIEVRLK